MCDPLLVVYESGWFLKGITKLRRSADDLVHFLIYVAAVADLCLIRRDPRLHN